MGRYKDIARLLLKYGRSDLVRQVGLDAALADDLDADSPEFAEARVKGDELAADLERLGPTFIKLGQLLSTRADLLPQPYLDGLARLQDDLEPFPFEVARGIIEDELGVRLSRIYDDFDETPLAAASLGQVHAAVLRGGRPVVVKVQRPGVRRQVFDDLEVLETLAERVEAHTDQGRVFAVTDLLGQFRRSLLDELDYRKEANNLVRLARIVEGRDRLVVPAPYDDFTTGRVLTMERIHGRKVTELSPLARLEIEGGALARDLFEAYLDQILVEGFFHADPHPGNVLLTDDGRLGLIDLGMVARVTPEMRERLIRLLLAVGERRGEEVARIAASMSTPTTDCDQRRFTADVAELVERDAVATVGQLDAGRLVLDLTRVCGAAGLRPPPELSMVGKALLNLDMVARILDPDVAPIQIVQDRAVELARGGITPSLSGILNAAMEARDFAEQLPGRVNRAMDALSSGRFELRVDAFDETEFLRGLHRMANRVATGLVLAALIVGAALLSNVRTTARIAGYPAVAFAFFMVAAIGGLYLVVSIMVGDRRLRRRR
ncbi:MAG: ubiquinone biosynthesis protein [Frankiaceae bacterium]|jgi:predicted unusual protein kinase regulating ubiquinone biosynthesis (AarF/ABC1/UbiB family)|nr:ubiquinone biosynthesis protein [Frankiaceae bacterium]